MTARRHHLLLCLTGIVLPAGSPAAAPAVEANSATWAQLLARSPFLPTGNGPGAAPTPATGLEFRGFFTLGQEKYFSVHIPARNLRIWLRLGYPEEGLLVRSHDRAADTIDVEYQGQRHTLTLHTAKVADGGSSLAGEPPGADLVPPRYIRNGLRNQSLYREEVEPRHMDNEWFREFVRKYGPPVYRPKP